MWIDVKANTRRTNNSRQCNVIAFRSSNHRTAVGFARAAIKTDTIGVICKSALTTSVAKTMGEDKRRSRVVKACLQPPTRRATRSRLDASPVCFSRADCLRGALTAAMRSAQDGSPLRQEASRGAVRSLQFPPRVCVRRARALRRSIQQSACVEKYSQ